MNIKFQTIKIVYLCKLELELLSETFLQFSI